MTIKLICWNIARRRKPWDNLVEMSEGADVALLQEVGNRMALEPPKGVETGPRAHWDSSAKAHPDAKRDRWPMVVKLSDRVEVEWFKLVNPETEPADDEVKSSGVGTMAAARIVPKDPNDGEPFIVVSMYALWNPDTGSSIPLGHILTDLNVLSFRPVIATHRIIAAGDLNQHYRSGAYKDMRTKELVDTDTDQYGYSYRIYREGKQYSIVLHRPTGEPFYIRRRVWKTLRGARAWTAKDQQESADIRSRTMSGEELLPLYQWWDHMSAIRMEFVGPQYPNGRLAHPTPSYMPSDTKNVPTFQRPGQTIEDADQQLDYVVASRGFHESVKSRALNGVEEWGASDHCRIMIEVARE